jgi:D-inositol-3-phosphate glycosyltransferase
VRERIVVVGQATGATGYARVLNSLFPHLCDRWDIHHFGLNYRGVAIQQRWTLHPNTVTADIHGIRQLAGLIQELRPRIVWFVHDLYLYALHAPMLARMPEVRTVAYFPVDGEHPRAEKLSTAARADRLVVFTNHARSALNNALTQLGCAPPSCHLPAIEVIPHGVDTEVFRPLAGYCEPQPRRAAARAQLFPNRPELHNAFVVLNANRNCLRKRIDLTLLAFALFSRSKPNNVYLYLHMGMKDRGVDIEVLAAEMGIERRLLRTTYSSEKPFITDDELNLIYNATNVGLNTTTGEGWGLVAFEHAATGAAQILPAHSACRELWDSGALLVPARSRVVNPFDFVDHAEVTAEDVASALELIYSDQALRDELSAQAYAKIQREELRWSAIAARWADVFCSLL